MQLKTGFYFFSLKIYGYKACAVNCIIISAI